MTEPADIALAAVVNRALALQRENPDWRIGQVAFNALADTVPVVAEKVRGTNLDPFHDDELLPAFWTFVALALGIVPEDCGHPWRIEPTAFAAGVRTCNTCGM